MASYASRTKSTDVQAEDLPFDASPGSDEEFGVRTNSMRPHASDLQAPGTASTTVPGNSSGTTTVTGTLPTGSVTVSTSTSAGQQTGKATGGDGGQDHYSKLAIPDFDALVSKWDVGENHD